MRRTLLATLAAMGLAACDSTAALKGETDDGELFTGTATASVTTLRPSGTLSLVSNKGTTCLGTYVYDDGRRGKAMYNCSNGESGQARIDANTMTGEGTIGSRRFNFGLANAQ